MNTINQASTAPIRNIQLIEPGKQLFTLLCAPKGSGQKFIASYNGSAILTTAHAELICYTATLIHHYGKEFTYTISSVQEMTMEEMNASMVQELEILERYNIVNAYAGAKVPKP